MKKDYYKQYKYKEYEDMFKDPNEEYEHALDKALKIIEGGK